MRLRWLVPTMGLFTLASVTACSSGGGSGSHGIGYGTPISTIAERLGCTDLTPVKDDEDSIDLGFKPLDEQTCTFEGHKLDIVTVKDEATMAAMISIAKGFIEGFGVEAYGSYGDGWSVTVESADDTADVPLGVQKSVSEDVVSAIGGKVIHLGTGAPSSEPVATATAPLQPATAIEESRAAAAAHIVPVGDTGELPDGIRFSVTGLTVGGRESEPWLAAKVHVENTSGEDGSVPNVGIVCANSSFDDPGGYQADSTIMLGDSLPGRSFRDGTLNLLLPGDDRTGESVSTCTAPAYVEAVPMSWSGDVQPSVRTPIPDVLVRELNAKLGS